MTSREPLAHPEAVGTNAHLPSLCRIFSHFWYFGSLLFVCQRAKCRLSYVADGRPLAATMVTAYPMPELKILLHPTLVDTPMGHRIIEFDRFVDRYTGSDKHRTEAHQMIRAQNALYQLAWAHRLNQSVEAMTRIEPSLDQELSKYPLLPLAEKMISDEEIRVQAEKALKLGEHLDNPGRSILKAKDEFYDAQLVSLIIKHADKPSSLVSFEKGIRSEFRARDIISLLIDKNKLSALFTRPPVFQIWSGVREKTFNITLDRTLTTT